MITNTLKNHDLDLDSWNNLVKNHQGFPNGVSPVSLSSICDLLLHTTTELVDNKYYLFDKDGQDEYLPCFLAKRRSYGVTHTALKPIASLFPGRSGPVMSSAHTDRKSRCLDNLLENSNIWDTFELSVVEHSAAHHQIESYIDSRKYDAIVICVTSFPYITMADTAEEHLQSFSKKFRYNYRSRKRKMESDFDIRIQKFTEIEHSSCFLKNMISIEQRSWKESAGSSISKSQKQLDFYNLALPDFAAHGVLRCYVLFLDERPVAHIIGCVSSGVFYCFKSSIDNEYRKYSPGVQLKMEVQLELIKEGILVWDFCGPSETHKLQWTKDCYRIIDYRLYSNTVKGRILKWIDVFRQTFSQLSRRDYANR